MLIARRSRLIPLLFVSLSLLVSVAAAARDLPGGNPKREGLSPQRLERISSHMNQAVADGIMVGGLGMIARNGKIVYRETWGLSDREANMPMREDAIFRIYSMTKPITAAARVSGRSGYRRRHRHRHGWCRQIQPPPYRRRLRLPP